MRIFPFFKPSQLIFHSSFSGNIAIGSSYGNKTLFVRGAPQSGGEFVHMWQTVFNTIKRNGVSPKNGLFLGIGGGTSMTAVKESFPDIIITAVEIDPMIVSLAAKYFGITTHSNQQIIIADATKWIKKQISHAVDLIVTDLYIGELNAPGTRDPNFLKDLKRVLTPQGIILFNSHFQKKSPGEFEEILLLCQKLFTKIEEVYRYPKNRILLLQP